MSNSIYIAIIVEFYSYCIISTYKFVNFFIFPFLFTMLSFVVVLRNVFRIHMASDTRVSSPSCVCRTTTSSNLKTET